MASQTQGASSPQFAQVMPNTIPFKEKVLKLATPEIPLFGEIQEETIISSSDDIDVIQLGTSGMEFNLRWFWWIYARTLALLLAKRVEQRSLAILKEKFGQQEGVVITNPKSREKMALNLPKARQTVFSKNRISELFEIKEAFFNKNSELMQHFCRYVATSEALDDVYNALGSFNIGGKQIWPEAALPDFWAKLHLSSPNAQSVRNRYRMVARKYYELGGGKTLSIACGSAQPLIHTIAEFNSEGKAANQNLLLTDISENSLNLAAKKARLAGVEHLVRFEKSSFQELERHTQERDFDVVEACGILDYLPENMSVALIRGALAALKDTGHILVSNMVRTTEAEALTKMYNWEIIYREPRDLGVLIKRAGGKNVKVYVDPWGIHTIATATK